MTDKHASLSTVAEMMDRDDHESTRKMVQLIATILIGLGLLFTGYLNFQLYSRAFSADSKIFGIIPALLIEGSLATFLLGSLVWFSHGAQGKLAKFFGWAMFGIVALNTIVEFNAQMDASAMANDFLKIYTFWGVPIVVPLVIGFWKAVIDADPSIQIMRMERKIAQTLQLAKHDSMLKALGSEDSRSALTAYGERAAAPINAQLRGTDGQRGGGQGNRNFNDNRGQYQDRPFPNRNEFQRREQTKGDRVAIIPDLQDGRRELVAERPERIEHSGNGHKGPNH